MMTRAFLTSTFALALIVPSELRAETTPPDPAVLVVRDASGAEHEFHRSDLEKMRAISFTTTTIWTDGAHEFSGVPLEEVLKASGVAGGDIELHAANDYRATMPVRDIGGDVPIVAYLYDGKPMSLRDKGPLWLVYPYDASANYQTETVYARSVWQLVRIEAKAAE